MVGIADGLGAFDNNDGTFCVLINHEIAAGSGVQREHGFAGAFVSHWIIRKSDLAEQDRTVVMGLDDTTPGQVYVYIGLKQSTGNEIEKAGLHGGSLYGIQVLGFPFEDVTTPPVPDHRGPGIASGARFFASRLW